VVAPLGPNNARITTLRRLSGRRRARLDTNLCVVEGPVAVREALESGAPVREVYLDAELAPDGHEPTPAVASVLRAARAQGVVVHRVSPGVVDRVTDTVSSQGVVALAERHVVDVARFAAEPGPVVVLAGVTDPGNAGTALRSAEAAGAAGVVFADDAVDPFGPKTVRAAAGSAFRVPVAEVAAGRATVAALLALHGAGRSLVGTVAAGGVAPEDLDLTRPFALVLGSEAHGLGVEVDTLVDVHLTIPMDGSVESLNVGVAGAVVLFEAARQRRRRP
jgi:RNA methyltransferase, TrmH family